MTHDWIVPDWPAPPGVRSLITTRSGGVSDAAYASMNLGEHLGDDARAWRENRRRLRCQLPSEPLWMRQVHGVGVIEAQSWRRGVEADGAVARSARRARTSRATCAECRRSGPLMRFHNAIS